MNYIYDFLMKSYQYPRPFGNMEGCLCFFVKVLFTIHIFFTFANKYLNTISQ